MRKLIFTTLAVAALVATSTTQARAEPTEVGIQRPIGVGLVAGSAPGLTMKIWTRPTSALDLGLGFGPGEFACTDRLNPCGERNSFNIDYLWQGGHSSYDRLSFHLGLGARFWFWNYGNNTRDFQVAARVPIGLDLYIFKWLEGYGEVAPSFAFAPNTFFLEAALGARMYL
jgi:hypothetical protein